MDENAKKRALLMIPYGLFILGGKHGESQTVATINWVTQASFNPRGSSGREESFRLTR